MPKTDERAGQATDRAELERQIMDPNVPKNEREWWAAREIERLRTPASGGAGEPVAWLYEGIHQADQNLPNDKRRWVERVVMVKPDDSVHWIRNVRPLYTRTPATDTEALQQRVERLEGALEPFADALGEDDEFPDDTPVTVKWGRTTYHALTLGDLRRVRDARVLGDDVG